jgi:hypothetical protein
MIAALEQLSVQIEASHGVRLQMRVGIDTGEMVVTGWPTARRGSSSSSARPPTAPPAADRRRPGSVLLSADTTRQVRGEFGLRRIRGLELKGIDGPVDAFVVVAGESEGYWPETAASRASSPATIGREQQLRQLQDAFAAVVSERPGGSSPSSARRRRQVPAGPRRRHLAGPHADRGLGAARPRLPVDRERAERAAASVFAERLGIRPTDAPDQVRRKWREGWAQLLGTEEPTDGDPRPSPRGSGSRSARRAAPPSAPPTPSRCGAGGAPWRCGCSTGSPSGPRRGAPGGPALGRLGEPGVAGGARPAPGGSPLLVLATARPTLLEQRPAWGRAGRCTRG